MRAYTLSVLSQLANTGNPIIEKEIVQWVNKKLASAGKTTSIKSFQDSSISNGKVVLDLIDAIKQGSINYDLVKDGVDEEEKSANAKYAISMARKIGVSGLLELKDSGRQSTNWPISNFRLKFTVCQKT